MDHPVCIEYSDETDMIKVKSLCYHLSAHQDIGFSFFEAVDSIDDVNEYDVPLNFCITPSRVYDF